MSSVHSSHQESVSRDGSDDFDNDNKMEITTAEMAALGLPSSFIARKEGPGKNKSRRKSSLSGNTEGKQKSAYSDVDLPEAGSSLLAKFCVRSVRLYAPNDVQIRGEEEILDCEIGLYRELTATADNAEDSPNFRSDPLQAPAKTRAEVEVPVQGFGEVSRADYDETNGGHPWEAIWDEQYQCYYFCNSQTWESTWQPPPGFDQFRISSLIGNGIESLDDGVEPVLAVGEISKFTVSDEAVTVVNGGASNLPEISTLATVEEVDNKEGSVLSFGQAEGLEISEELTTVMSGSAEALRSDPDGQSCSHDSMEDAPPFLNSHVRFRDSSDSSSEEEEVKGIDREEMNEERSAKFIRVNTTVEEEQGSEACTSCSEHWASSIHNEQHLALTDKYGGSEELDKVHQSGMVGEMTRRVLKYWFQRYSLFSKYDEGVKMDEEGWYSVTPEIIARHQASRCAAGLVIDGFTGVGGNAIQLARKSHQVIAIDIDPKRIEYARHNAEIYKVAHKIEFIVGDFFQLAPFLKADVVFLSPPWGGPEYLKEEIYDLNTMLQPKNGTALFKVAQSIAPSIALFVPRNVDLNQLQELSWLSSPPLACEVEENFVNDKLKAITAYYGEIAFRN